MSKRPIIIASVLTVVLLMLTPAYAQAAALTSYTTEVNFAAIGAADQVQNNLDQSAKTNADTWDPVPGGVWFGGWPVESLLRIDEVPDTDFVLAMATVCRFNSNIIMSGAARTIVRLPVYTSTDPWATARLNIYRISEDSNWTFQRHAAVPQTPGYGIGPARIEFTAGTHELVFWSAPYSPTDISPTDGNDHYTRSNRTYAIVDAPIHPNAFYLFVTYVRYGADKYVDCYLQPDSLDSGGDWNRSTLAIYNEQAPDTWTIEVNNFNASMGYSFDFRNGFGNSAYGLNLWVDQYDDIEFFSYVDPGAIVGTDYLTFMLPYRSTLDNISFNITLQEFNPTVGSYIEFASYQNYICRDFILFSLEQDWSTCSTANGLLDTGWFKIAVRVNNDTRIWLPVWDIPAPEGGGQFNSSWAGVDVEDIWDSDTDTTYNFMQRIEHERRTEGGFYNYHWGVQHSVQFNNYRWDRTAPPTTGTEGLDPTDDMSLSQKLYWGIGLFLIVIGNTVHESSPHLGNTFRFIGTGLAMLALTPNVSDMAGDLWDKLQPLRDFFGEIGKWLWRAAQAIVGFLQFVIDLVSFALGVIILILAIVVAALPIILAFHIGMSFRKAMLGDLEGAKRELAAGVTTITKAAGR